MEKTGAGGREVGSGCLEKLTVGEEVGVAVRKRQWLYVDWDCHMDGLTLQFNRKIN